MRKSFDITTAAGLTLGFVAVFGSFLLEGGKFDSLVILPAMLVVFLGTFAAAMIGTSLKNFLALGKMIVLAVMPPVYDVKGSIRDIVRFSTIARKEGLLALERELGKIETPFLKKVLRFAIDGTEPEVLRSLAENEVSYMSDRHTRLSGILQKMGGYSPTMGIIGTVMGLISTLGAAGDDANTLIHHIASAFIATLWGVFMANIVWLPLADKLKHINNEEFLYMDIITEGVLSIQAGEIPSVIKARLNSMLPSADHEVDNK